MSCSSNRLRSVTSRRLTTIPPTAACVQQVGEQTLGVQQATVAVADAKLERLARAPSVRASSTASAGSNERPVLVGDVIQESAADEVRDLVSEDLREPRGSRTRTVVSDASTRITSLECWTSALRRTSLSVRSALSQRVHARGCSAPREPDHPDDHQPEHHDRGGSR